MGHRGASSIMPENTRSAFLKAIELQADMIELDVHLTKDGRLVITHDFDVVRQTGKAGQVEHMTLDELKQLDFATFIMSHNNVESILTLEEYFELIPQDFLTNIEIKNKAGDHCEISQRLVHCLQSLGKIDQVIISGFDHHALEVVHQYDQRIKLGLLFYGNLIDPLSYIKNIGFPVYSVHLAVEHTQESYVKKLINEGYNVYVYTVNDKKDAENLVAWGISGIITNDLLLLS